MEEYDYTATFYKSMALIRAIHNLAKLYHWKTVGTDFYQDHLFFDRIADTFNEDLVDKIAENYFMRHHDEIDVLNNLDSEVSAYTEMYKNASIDSYFVNLDYLVDELLNITNNAYSDSETRTCRTVNVLLDEIAITASGMQGLLKGRINLDSQASTDNNNEMFITEILPYFYESSDMKIAMKEGIAGLFIHKKLGIPEHVTIREAYNSPNALYKELSRYCPKEARTVLQMAGNMPEDCERLDKEAPYTD